MSLTSRNEHWGTLVCHWRQALRQYEIAFLTVIQLRTPQQRAALILCDVLVIHMGDTFFNGFYPVIDASTGGKIDGMIVAADKVLPLADNNTKIVPGHGPLGNNADLTKYRDMLVVARDRVQKLKTAVSDT
jgi:glyoxylase-like metal-dependent hydrolase (beta-lactamase superfamily II)